MLVPAARPIKYKIEPLTLGLTTVGLVLPEIVKLLAPLLAKMLMLWLWPIFSVGLVLPKLTPLVLVLLAPLTET